MSELTLTIKGVYGRHLPMQHPNLPATKLKTDRVFQRRRLNTKVDKDASHGPEGPDYAYIEPGQGLVGHDMYHTNYTVQDWSYEERAILMQSLEMYFKMMKHDVVGKYYKKFEAGTEEESIELILQSPMFGEQLIVEGCDTSQLCIGDVFAVKDGESELEMEVTSPRLPCSAVDRKFGSAFGEKGVRRNTLNETAAGWFCRVLKGGRVVDGMKLVRVKQPHPEWTLTRASKALYGHNGTRMKYLSCWPVWGESVDKLREFVNLEQLGEYEWGEEAQYILEKMEEEIEEKAVSDAEGWCSSSFGSATMASVGACACLSPVLLSMMLNLNGLFQ